MGQQEPETWPERWALAIRNNLVAIRGKVSTRELSERCTDLGHPIARSTIASIETGDRKSTSLPELAVLARALDVPPVRLLYNVRDGATPVEVLPGKKVAPIEAMLWFGGGMALTAQGSLLGEERGDDGGIHRARWEYEAQDRADYVIRSIASQKEYLGKLEDGTISVDPPSDRKHRIELSRARLEGMESGREDVLRVVIQARARLRDAGMTPPPLRESIREAVEAIGGDV